MSLPPLPTVSVSSLSTLTPPTTKIKFEEDLETWRTTSGYNCLVLFVRRLSEAVVGHDLPTPNVPFSSSEGVERVLRLLETLDGWIEEIPPLDTPQRFGNLAFRTWGSRLEERAESVLADMLGPSHQPVIPFLLPYLLTSFGSFTRLDYGSGHEASFLLFLLSLSLVSIVGNDVSTERDVALRIFTRYLRLCFRLQDVYRLEPAGSHGVWGLDDHHFLGYVLGSAQLRDQIEIAPSSILRKPLPETNLYFVQINRIQTFKTGPFAEHSAQLYNIAMGVPLWSKVHSGLVKMYQGEVLGKRVVVQHLPLGGLIPWDPPSDGGLARSAGMTSGVASRPNASHPGGLVETTVPHQAVTRAPWA